jgi:hypothetical protein
MTTASAGPEAWQSAGRSSQNCIQPIGTGARPKTGWAEALRSGAPKPGSLEAVAVTMADGVVRPVRDSSLASTADGKAKARRREQPDARLLM